MNDEQWQRLINERGVEFAGNLVIVLMEKPKPPAGEQGKE